ncbi:oxidoreductase [Streptomyces sp. NBC_01136]|uniref:oxidoreductase n=1 Tax=unclassified Streptomyces TaxID=2593676 RepID=UPI003245C36B|nr:oxidoreductase [Streptomyces sp. NBC_01136]
MDLQLNDTVAVVTGASRGIGLAVVEALVAEGAQVVAAARSSSAELDALAKSGQVRVVRADLTDPAAAAEVIEAAGGRIDVLVNNVGSAPARPGGFLSVTDEEWLRTLDLNLLVAVRVTRQALPLMIAAGRGSIVSVCSVNSVLADPTVIDYCAAKAALANFSKALSKEVGPRGIRVNTVSPGPVETDLWMGDGGVAATVSEATGLTPQQVVEQAAQGSVTGRFSQPSEVADLVLLLASERSGNVTGSDIVIDGGLLPTW